MKRKEEWRWRWNTNYLFGLEFHPKFEWSIFCPMMDRKRSHHHVDMTFLVKSILCRKKWSMFIKKDIYKLDDFFSMGKYYPHSREKT
jgi:hypothetical protein